MSVEVQIASHVHAPKVETFDLDRMTNTDPKGIVRTVDRFEVHPFGLFLARPVVGHHRIAYLRSWLLPELGLRVTDYDLHPGAVPDCDLYLDLVAVTPGRTSWTSVDHYLDLLVWTGRGITVVDSDELLAALAADLLDPASAQIAMENTHRAVEGIAANGHDVFRWLRTAGFDLAGTTNTPHPALPAD
ncbi:MULTISPECIES: DUF402 domain-containing protein [Actinoalloteichus]|uniref:DUF402 domain-containing protein n=1 Tax=Actinoalloteichus fjordicus TaxID=1612552 RepID=A0AAC9PRK7_9PSEU|nr:MULTISPECIES: DUF402 domain-containing protein [Actinoalloteichus]APU14198.1 hypothetical protein UA74_10690 [Actinoalloteichus fjordicus]APU20167.1 hypothetical protein UA75_10775 [Actinoalloteichus sp. GBA129-24]